MEESELRNTAPEYDPKPCPLCGRTMRRGLLQCNGNLFFTDEECSRFEWPFIEWPLKRRGDIRVMRSYWFSDDGRTKLAQICTDCEVVLLYYGKKWDDRRWNR